jgi:hypothetical protein
LALRFPHFSFDICGSCSVNSGTALALVEAVDRHARNGALPKQAALAVATIFSALVAVGLTSSGDSPLSLSVHPVLLRVERSAAGQLYPRVLALDVDLKIGSLHAHAGWPGFAFVN